MEEEEELTPEQQLAEKLKVQKMQEEADLELAKEAFGKILEYPVRLNPDIKDVIFPDFLNVSLIHETYFLMCTH